MRLSIRRAICLAAAALLLLPLSTKVRAEKPWPGLQEAFGKDLADGLDIFEVLYGEEVEAALATATLADDAEQARALADDAGKNLDQKPLAALMAQHAFVLGLRSPDGHAAADDAMKLLLAHTPPNTHHHWRAKQVDLYRLQLKQAPGGDKAQVADRLVVGLTELGDAASAAKQFKAAAAHFGEALELARSHALGSRLSPLTARAQKADEAVRLQEQAMAKAEAARQAAMEKARLAKLKAEQEENRKQMWAMLIDKDDPAAAMPFASKTGLGRAKKLVPLAARDTDTLSAQNCLDLGSWYDDVARNQASGLNKAKMMRRAWNYLHRFTIVETRSNPERDEAERTLSRLARDLKTYGYSRYDLGAASPPTVRKLERVRSKAAGIEFVRVPSGTYRRGSPNDEPGRGDDETRHQVKLTRGFYISTTEVTQAQWERVMNDNPSKARGDHLPVESVSWSQAMRFCAELSKLDGGSRVYRLPSEAEWEFACRATHPGPFANRAGPYDLAWHAGNSKRTPHAVATKAANAWGLYDVHGNVAEWCFDWYADYPAGPLTNPGGARRGDGHVVRGGSWQDAPEACRAAARNHAAGSTKSPAIGFRIVIDPHTTTGGSGKNGFFGIPTNR